MSKPVLSVPGIDPARIECCTGKDGRQIVNAMGYPVASLTLNGEVAFYANYSDSIRENCKKVMNAAIDHWRATGRLFPEPPPEPPPEPVECVCGGKMKFRPFGVYLHPECEDCDWRGPKVMSKETGIAEWNAVMVPALAALKAAKEGKS